MIQAELAHHTGFKDWWQTQQAKMAIDDDLKLLNDFRVMTFHKSSLIPGSSIFAGHFKYGRPKSGLVMDISPLTPTLPAFLHARKILANMEHPHRMWESEEFGIQRTWRLKEIEDRELVGFCIDCWNKLAAVLAACHSDLLLLRPVVADPLIHPVVDGLVPELGVLRFQHPVALVRGIEHFRRQAHDLQGGEELESFELPVDDECRRFEVLRGTSWRPSTIAVTPA
jgi:hypothetical protein